MSVKENVINHQKNRYEINRFRNGDITQNLTGVDIEEVVETSGYVVEFFEVFICYNSEYNPAFERLILDMTEKRNNFKRE